MHREEIVELLLSGRNLVVSRSLNSLLKLVYSLVAEISRTSRNVVIVDERGYVARYLPQDFPGDVVLTLSLEDACREEHNTVLVVAPRNLSALVKCKSRNLVVFSRASRDQGLKGFTRFYLRKVPGVNEYLLECFDRGVTTRVGLEPGGLTVIESPPGIQGLAYEALKNALSAFGELTVKDAVLVLSKELGLDKKKARAVLVALAKRSYIRVYKGRVGLP